MNDFLSNDLLDIYFKEKFSLVFMSILIELLTADLMRLFEVKSARLQSKELLVDFENIDLMFENHISCSLVD